MARVKGLDTDGHGWEASLNPHIAAQLMVEDPADMDDGSVWWSSPQFAEEARLIRAQLEPEIPEVAAAAIAWATSAGVAVPAQQQRIEEVLRSQEPFAETIFFTLLDALGFPAAPEVPEP